MSLAAARRLAPLAPWVGLLLWLTGCGYSAGLKLPPGQTTVGIQIFANEGPEPNVERDLHREMTRSMRNLVTGQIVAPDQADVVVAGRIRGYQRRGGLRTGGNQLRETGLVIQIEAWLLNDRGQPLGRSSFRVINVGYLTGFLGAEEEAQLRALKNLADGLLLQLFGPQGEPVPEELRVDESDLVEQIE